MEVRALPRHCFHPKENLRAMQFYEPGDDWFERCPFPKHRGKLWEDVLEEDPQYVEWLVSGEGPAMSDALYEHLTIWLEEYL